MTEGMERPDFPESVGRQACYTKGSWIYSAGDPGGQEFYYLMEGRVKIVVINDQGEEKTLTVLERGNFFGEPSFFDKSPHFATAVAVLDSQVKALTWADCRHMLDEESEAAHHLLKSLCYKVRMLAMQVEDLAFFNIEKRLCRFLLKLLSDFNVQTEHGLALSIILTDDQLGQHIGARREAVSKFLNKLKNQGLIKKEGRRICFPDLDALHKYLVVTSAK
jgi:CRP-like cAMP-binding protein